MVLAKSALVLLATLSAVVAEPQVPGQNAYLPPDPNQPKGYNYPTPSIPFQPGRPTPGPSFTPGPRPTNPPYTPSQPTYTPGRPPFVPGGSPPFVPGGSPPIRPTNTYGTPPPSRPTYGPPPTGTRPPYRPDDGLTTPGIRPPVGPPGGHDHGHVHGEDHVHVPGMPYDFNYAVKDDYYGTDYSHNAASDGDVVTGEYRVALPDGRLQIVRYTADWKTGFHADVQYQGEPRYPDTPAGGPAGNYGTPGRRPGGGY